MRKLRWQGKWLDWGYIATEVSELRLELSKISTLSATPSKLGWKALILGQDSSCCSRQRQMRGLTHNGTSLFPHSVELTLTTTPLKHVHTHTHTYTINFMIKEKRLSVSPAKKAVEKMKHLLGLITLNYRISLMTSPQAWQHKDCSGKFPETICTPRL